MALKKRLSKSNIDKHNPNSHQPDIMILPRYDEDGRHHIALVQPGSWGDNIISTLMFKPLAAKYPNLMLDVYTSTLYGNAFRNNPYVNNIYEFEAHSKNTALHLLHTIPKHLEDRGYHHIFRPHPMLNPDKWTSTKYGHFGDHFMCAWMRALEDYNVPYGPELETIMVLENKEVWKVNGFLSSIELGSKTYNLMEVGAESGQTFSDHNWMIAIAGVVCGKGEALFVSSRECGPAIEQIIRKYPGLCFHVGCLSIRESAELFNRCKRFFSISSGLSNACNTSWCKKDIEWYEVVNSPAINSAPIRKEGKTFWYENDLGKFIQMLRTKV
jgi:hypothetical protein